MTVDKLISACTLHSAFIKVLASIFTCTDVFVQVASDNSGYEKLDSHNLENPRKVNERQLSIHGWDENKDSLVVVLLQELQRLNREENFFYRIKNFSNFGRAFGAISMESREDKGQAITWNESSGHLRYLVICP